MKAKELAQKLLEHPELEVLLSNDSEGNYINPVMEVSHQHVAYGDETKVVIVLYPDDTY